MHMLMLMMLKHGHAQTGVTHVDGDHPEPKVDRCLVSLLLQDT